MERTLIELQESPEHYATVSMDTARNKVKEVCEQGPGATITMVISYGNGTSESLKIIVADTP